MILLTLVQRWATPGRHALTQFDAWALAGSLVALVALAVTLGATVVRHVWLNRWGALVLGGVVVLGIVVPLLLEIRPRAMLGGVTAAVLVLLGGFPLRVAIPVGPRQFGSPRCAERGA